MKYVKFRYPENDLFCFCTLALGLWDINLPFIKTYHEIHPYEVYK